MVNALISLHCGTNLPLISLQTSETFAEQAGLKLRANQSRKEKSTSEECSLVEIFINKWCHLQYLQVPKQICTQCIVVYVAQYILYICQLQR